MAMVQWWAADSARVESRIGREGRKEGKEGRKRNKTQRTSLLSHDNLNTQEALMHPPAVQPRVLKLNKVHTRSMTNISAMYINKIAIRGNVEFFRQFLKLHSVSTIPCN